MIDLTIHSDFDAALMKSPLMLRRGDGRSESGEIKPGDVTKWHRRLDW